MKRSRVERRDRYIDMKLQYKLRDEYIKICRANDGVLISTEMPIDECYMIFKNEVERVMNK